MPVARPVGNDTVVAAFVSKYCVTCLPSRVKTANVPATGVSMVSEPVDGFGYTLMVVLPASSPSGVSKPGLGANTVMPRVTKHPVAVS